MKDIQQTYFSNEKFIFKNIFYETNYTTIYYI